MNPFTSDKDDHHSSLPASIPTAPPGLQPAALPGDHQALQEQQQQQQHEQQQQQQHSLPSQIVQQHLPYDHSVPISQPVYTTTTDTGPPADEAHLEYRTEPMAMATEDVEFEDADFNDVDSAYDSASQLADDTTSLASYLTDYIYENGRRYHAYQAGKYWGPNDERHAANELIAHHMYLITLDGRLHLAPLGPDPHEILDVGTGFGNWAIEIAEEYPSASVTGTDLSPTQPDFVPPNCSFEIDDVTLEWTYADNRFDFVHIREMFGCIPDWDYLLWQAKKCTKPGGWIEIVEHSVWPVSDDGTVGPDHFFNEWGATVEAIGEKSGKTFRIWRQSKEKLIASGWTDVVEHHFKWPINTWHPDPKMKELGQWNTQRLLSGVEGFMLRLLTSIGGMSVEQAQLFLAQMRKHVGDRNIHAFLETTVVYGRKPLA